MNRLRPGFALNVVLWFLVGGFALAMGLVSAARSTLHATTNRVFLARGQWRAEGCLDRLRSVADDTLLSPASASERGWRNLDTVAMRAPLLSGCQLELRPVGIALDANVVTAFDAAIVLRAMGYGDAADSIADAIVDWRDADDLVGPNGAEMEWYVSRGLLPPRNAPFVAREEILYVRGTRRDTLIAGMFDIEPARLLVPRSTAAILSTLPGFGPEAVARATLFSGDDSPRDLLDFSTRLSPLARAELLANFVELEKRVTWSPEAWIATSRVAEGRPPVETTVEVKFVRAGRRAATVQRRVWP